MRSALAVLVAVLLLVAGASLAGFASAQEKPPDGTTLSTTSTGLSTTTDVAPPAPPPADMPFETFRERRVAKRHNANRIRYAKGYRKTHAFRLAHREVKPWHRGENIAYWQSKVDQAKSLPRAGAFGHRWRWYEGHPERGWGFYERAAGVMARRVFGASAASWAISCSRSEGHGMMVWNGGYFDPYLTQAPGPAPGGSSTAYGPMQFMSGTLYGSVDGAFYYARHRGFKGLPNKYKRWNSNIAQALTAAYIYTKGGTSAWTGASC